MRLRRLLLVDKKSLKLTFTHTFYVTEAQCLNNDQYCEIPSSNKILLETFLEKYTIESEYNIKFKPFRDSCDREDWFPVYSLNIDNKLVWPVVFITTSKYLVIGIPLMKMSDKTAGFREHPEIPATIQLLDTLGNFLKELASELTAEQPQVTTKWQFICVPVTLKRQYNGKEYLQSNAKQSPLITITIKETVRGILFNRKRIEDKYDYTGSIVLISTLPVSTDISVTLLTTLDLTHIVPGPLLDKFHNTAPDNRLQLFLTPGYDTTEVFKYTFDQVKPPILGRYEVTNGNPGLKFTVDLQFFVEQKIMFDYIEVTMPFPNRGPITSLQYEPHNSDVLTNKKKNQVVWRRSKPPVTEKLSLSGQIMFDSKHTILDGHPHLRDLNSYMDITFKSTSSTTMSKMRLDRGSVTVFPAVKFKLNYEVQCSGAVIRVWNCLGDVIEQ